MRPNLAQLDAHLSAEDAHAYLIEADSDDANQLYLSGFDASDPFVTTYVADKSETQLLVSGLEYGRAKKESRAGRVFRHADFGFEYGDREARYDMYVSFLSRVADAEASELTVAVPSSFPLGSAEQLRERGVELVVDDDDTIGGMRAVKTDEEIDHVRDAQRANEAAMRTAEGLIAAADVDETGTLVSDGEPLTSEEVRSEIEITLLRHGCSLDETIVACGSGAADPHDRGSGPLSAGEPIIVDIFPKSKATGYHSDMTRTFSKGQPSETIREWYDLTREALEAALDAVEPGATGAEVHGAACEVYETAGEPTLRSDPETETGFIHSTGHGVGLDVHESPSLSPSGGELEAGHVITVEPGLYDPAHGGVRIEDIVVVTEDGYENLTEYPIELVVE
ncbi:Xaa-Pro peptidase family protein [Halalkaliarchaeum sp. AArc-GB]|uniref:Xaa-Pro peptidase family protein n=1 Tax=Halalkaliarchaeum sp. AArc-GB TaxID=3074078 RepID=UPI00285B2C79|nr:Xaa-Pro peptidase family protein [Halalkaliarchaeum sp. AArc-GB]MDR5674143.1 Xaa-Pro peptidase family protein [Halalkaliarchaeum sp. AArc-GB]